VYNNYYLGVGVPAYGAGYAYGSGGYGRGAPVYNHYCNGGGRLVGSLVGGATGGFIGSHIGQGSGRIGAIAAGSLIGLLAGGAIGAQADYNNCY
jgi:outer membrane lipoprotein SlyB